MLEWIGLKRQVKHKEHSWVILRFLIQVTEWIEVNNYKKKLNQRRQSWHESCMVTRLDLLVVNPE